MSQNLLPFLVTFDGEARSGKGTVVQATKDYLRDQCGYRVMLIDRGQTFRTLVVAARRNGVDLDDTAALDQFLSDERNAKACVQFVKKVYHMEKSQRDRLLYTNRVSEDSAKVGARATSQDFVRTLTKKWLHDAQNEGYDVVLIDGRALESIATEMHDEQLCDYRVGLYFVCDYQVGARRTLGYAAVCYDELSDRQRQEVDQLVDQIRARNQRDFDRESERLVPPVGAPVCALPHLPTMESERTHPMFTIDTSAELTKQQMSQPVARLVARYLATRDNDIL